MTSTKPILNFVIDPALLKRIDDFRYKQRFPTRAEAVKWLLGYALSRNPKPQTDEGQKPSGR